MHCRLDDRQPHRLLPPLRLLDDPCLPQRLPANGDWSECTLNAAGLAAVNKTGKTQVRIRFTTDDTGNDYLGYFAGDNGTAANRPQLVVTYQ